MSAIAWGTLIGLLLLLYLAFRKLRPLLRRSNVARVHQRLIYQLEARRGSRVITLIERQKIVSFLGLPLSRSLTIDDPAQVLHIISFTPPDEAIDLIVHTTGAWALAAEPIANALVRHNGPVTLIVPYYAMPGGARLALASDKVQMSRDAVLGPETCLPGSRPARGALESLAQIMNTGRWTPTAPMTFDIAREMGMRVSDDVPAEAYQLIALYPQAASRPLSVQPVLISSASDDERMPEPEKA